MVFLLFQLLFKRYSNNFVVNLLGKWKESEYSQSGQLIPVGGLVYYITPPTRYFRLLPVYCDPVTVYLYGITVYLYGKTCILL
jgi:hypothetical protein